MSAFKDSNKQQPQATDTCHHCGSHTDIGTLIDEGDTELVIEFSGEGAQHQSNALASVAKSRFPNTRTNYDGGPNSGVLRLMFEFSVEKLIFQLEQGL